MHATLLFSICSLYNLLSTESPTVLVYLSPISTMEEISKTNEQLEDLGYNILISEPVFNESGYLSFYEVDMKIPCKDEKYDLSDQVSLDNNIIGVIFIGPECQHGAYNVPSTKDDGLAGFLFKDKQPDQIMVTWDGTLEELVGKKAKDFR